MYSTKAILLLNVLLKSLSDAQSFLV